jgi:hypothetical protein
MDTRRLAPVLALAVLAGCTSAVTSTLPGTTFTPTPTSAPPSSPAPLKQIHDPGQVTYSVTYRAGTCHTRDDGQLPDATCTPGSTDPEVTQADLSSTICVPKQEKDGKTEYVLSAAWNNARPPAAQTDQARDNVIEPAYSQAPGTAGEVDHLVAREIGGSNDITNLWLEAGKIPNSKDSTESLLHSAVCSGKVTLVAAQEAMAANWMTAGQVLGLAHSP